jgi:hypothetical protein
LKAAHLARTTVRVFVVALIAVAGLALFAVDGRQHARPAAADPAYGNVKFNPTSQVVLENYIFNVPVRMTTCTDIAQNVKGTISSATTTTLTDTTKSWTTNQWAKYALIITQGAGSPQQRTIVSNTANTLTVSSAFAAPTPGAGTKYEIVALSGQATSGTSTTMVDTTKSWTTNQYANADVVLLSGTNSPQQRKVVSNTSNTLTVDEPWGNIQQFGTATGATASTLVDSGSGWIANQFAGMHLELTGAGGSQIRTVASNTTDTLTVSSPWATAQATANPTGGTSTTLVDTSKAWTPNAFVNKTVEITGGPLGLLTRTITANTSNTLTISGTWPVSEAGGSNSGTSNTITDLVKTWTANQWTGFTIELTGGTGAGQSRTVASNTATVITVTSAWATIPDGSTSYQVLRTPAATTSYIVRDGPAQGTTYQVRGLAAPAAGTGYQLLNLKCHTGGYGLTINYPSSKFTVVSDSGFADAAGTNTLTENGKTWKVNQWAGTQVKIVGGGGFGQIRQVVSNTANTLTVTPAWSTTPSAPKENSGYALGGLTDGGWISSTGRAYTCPIPATYGTGTAEIACVSFSPLPQGPTSAGSLVNLTLQAGSHQGNVLQSFSLTNAEVLQVDGTVIPADVFVGSRRVILCPDSAPPLSPDGVVNVGDQAVTSQAVLAHATANPPSPLYSTKKDPNEDGVVNPGDQAIVANVLNKKCVQP